MTSTLRDVLAEWRPRARARVDRLAVAPVIEHVGTVSKVGDGVATVRGLPHARLGELLDLSGVPAMTLSLSEHHIGCVLLGPDTAVHAGDRVRGTGRVARVPVGRRLLGRVIDPLGRPLDDGGPIATGGADRDEGTAPIEQPAPAVLDRDLVRRPLRTGILAIDALLPLGRGQRELLVGDRSTGKTSLAVDAIIAQRDSDVVCVYAAIGQTSSTIQEVIAAVHAHGAPERTAFVVGEADGAPGLSWIAPYAACTVAEYFAHRGEDVLLVLDDLSKHAAVHRQLSLLLRVPPGREAYPGDIFYAHSRLLERSAQLSEALGGGSLTALPIVETQAGNLTAYIPTNLVSITDGQVVLEPRLFHEGQRPAVDVGLSVSRVGGKTQPPALVRLASRLRLDYAQYLELEVFTRFGGLVLDEHTRRALDRGRRIRAALRQGRFSPYMLAQEVAILLAVERGAIDRVPLDRVPRALAGMLDHVATHCGAALARVAATGELTDGDRDDVVAAIENALEPWAS